MKNLSLRQDSKRFTNTWTHLLGQKFQEDCACANVSTCHFGELVAERAQEEKLFFCRDVLGYGIANPASGVPYLYDSPVGLKLQKGNNYSQVVENSFHISKATLAPADGKCKFPAGVVAVHAVVDGTDFIICYLGRVESEALVIQKSLNLNIVDGQDISLYIDYVDDSSPKEEGNAVHLTGYFVQLFPDDTDVLFESDSDTSDVNLLVEGGNCTIISSEDSMDANSNALPPTIELLSVSCPMVSLAHLEHCLQKVKCFLIK